MKLFNFVNGQPTTGTLFDRVIANGPPSAQAPRPGLLPRARRIVFSILVLPAALSANAGQANAVIALEVLKRIMKDESGLHKVHAAEVLSAHGAGGEVYPVFLQEERNRGTERPIRIGIWRVLAGAADTADRREQWQKRIETVFLDAAAPDRLYALESLCKLNWAAHKSQIPAIRRWQATVSPADAVFGDWALALAGDDQIIASLASNLQCTDDLVRIRAAAVLKRLAVHETGVLALLAKAASRANRSMLERAHVVGAALVLDAHPEMADTWRNALETVIQSGTPTEAYVAWQGLLGRVTAMDIIRLAPDWSNSHPSFAVGAAWAILAGDGGSSR